MTILIILILAALIVCAVIIIMLLKKNKSGSSSDTASESSSRNRTTFYIPQEDENNSTTNTKYLFSSGSTRHINLISSDDENIVIDIMLNRSVTIGRSDQSDIVVNFDNSISKKHCTISLSEDKIVLEDLHSANKTYINDIEITSPTTVTDGDTIRLGRTKFVLKVLD